MARQKKASYEDHHEIIYNEIYKHKSKWFLDSMAWMDFDDVAQIISSHIASKWDKWDQKRALKPWINKIISNQFKNILRNNYSNFVRPCLNCPFSIGDKGSEDFCSFTDSKKQDCSCPLYAKWSKTKRSAYNIKMAVSMENQVEAVTEIKDPFVNIDSAAEKLHKEMKLILGERHWKVYEMLFVEHKSEQDVAKAMGYKTSEKGRSAGYKQIKNLKKQFKDKAKKILATKDIFIKNGKR